MSTQYWGPHTVPPSPTVCGVFAKQPWKILLDRFPTQPFFSKFLYPNQIPITSSINLLCLSLYLALNAPYGSKSSPEPANRRRCNCRRSRRRNPALRAYVLCQRPRWSWGPHVGNSAEDHRPQRRRSVQGDSGLCPDRRQLRQPARHACYRRRRHRLRRRTRRRHAWSPSRARRARGFRFRHVLKVHQAHSRRYVRIRYMYEYIDTYSYIGFCILNC